MLTQSYEDLEKILKSGRMFTRYVTNSRGQVEADTIFLFLHGGGGDPMYASLYWCEPGTRKMIDQNCLPVPKIAEVLLGKSTPELRDVEADEAPTSNCLSILNTQHRLNLEAESVEVVTAWIMGLTALMDRCDNLTVYPSNDKKRYTIKTGQYQQTPPARSNVVGQQNHGGSAARNALVRGHDFQLFSQGRNGLVNVEDVRVVLDDSQGEPGLLRIKGGNRSFNLDELTDVYMGKQTQILESPEARHVPEECCFSLVARGQKMWNLVHDSPDAIHDFILNFKIVCGVEVDVMEAAEAGKFIIPPPPRTTKFSSLLVPFPAII